MPAQLITDEQVRKAYARYENNETIESMAKDYCVCGATLTKHMHRLGLPLRKSKHFNDKVTPENSSSGGNKKEYDGPRLCGNCMKCKENCMDTDECQECYFEKGKPHFVPKPGL